MPGKGQAGKPYRNWRELADFFVSFGYSLGDDGKEHLKTKVHYSQAGTSQEWDGLVSAELTAWMFDQADLPVPEETQPEAVEEAAAPDEGMDLSPAEPETTPDEPLSLEFHNLRVQEVQVPVGAAGEETRSMLRAEGNVVLAGPYAFDLTFEYTPLVVELYLVNTATNESKLAATYNGQFSPGQLTSPVQHDIDIPAHGTYQLYVISRLLPPYSVVAHLQGPNIRVQP